MSARPTIGERGRRFTLEHPLDTPDGFGGHLRSWEAGPLLWGSMATVGEGERTRAGRSEAFATHRVVFPHRGDITPDHRLALGPRRFRIRHAGDPDGSRRVLHCLVEEIAP